MEKTTVYLSSQQKAALAAAAAEQGRSEAWLIRAGIQAVLGGHRVAESPAALEPSPGGVLASSGPTSEPLDPATPPARPRWVARDAFVRLVAGAQADPGLREDLRTIAPGFTDEEPLA